MVCIPVTFYQLMPNNGVWAKQILIFIGTCQAPHFSYKLSSKDKHKICFKIWNIPLTKYCVAILTPNEHSVT